jgi:hypothetical protein
MWGTVVATGLAVELELEQLLLYPTLLWVLTWGTVGTHVGVLWVLTGAATRSWFRSRSHCSPTGSTHVGYWEYSRGVLWVPTWGTVGTHVGVLWVLTGAATRSWFRSRSLCSQTGRVVAKAVTAEVGIAGLARADWIWVLRAGGRTQKRHGAPRVPKGYSEYSQWGTLSTHSGPSGGRTNPKAARSTTSAKGGTLSTHSGVLGVLTVGYSEYSQWGTCMRTTSAKG